MADPARYLLPTERPVISTRRHWAVLAGATIQSLLLLILGILLARVFAGVDFVEMVAIWFSVFVVARWIWIFVDWYVEKLVVTDKRLLLLTGILARNVAIMPLVKVTDLTFHRSATGLTLGYGKFVVESAGQDQALSTIDFVPQPEKLYIQISELLFGGDKGAPGALVTAAQREAEEQKDQAARGRWRRFARRRQQEADEQADAAPSTPTTSQFDQILAHRDQVLLADRDDPEWAGPDYTLDDPDLGDPRGAGDDADPDGDDPYRRPDPTVELPRFHEPRRGEPGRSGAPLPPPRRPPDTPPPAGSDPADD
jgi:membrane protein YdbS with pleckstrin-like domain